MIPPLAEIHTTMHKAQKGTAIYKVQMPVKVFTLRISQLPGQPPSINNAAVLKTGRHRIELIGDHASNP